MPHVIAEPCIGVKDGVCVAACPVDCIGAGERMHYINPRECIDCGACAESCPVRAIYPAGDLPEIWKFYAEINVGFYPGRDEETAWAGHTFPGEKVRRPG